MARRLNTNWDGGRGNDMTKKISKPSEPDRLSELESKFRLLLRSLHARGVELPAELLTEASKPEPAKDE